MPAIIDARGIVKRYGEITAVNNVDLANVCITPGGANTSLDVGCQPDGPMLEIFEIQGSGLLSPVDGQTVVTPSTRIDVQEDGNQLVVVRKGVSIGEVVNALNALGVTPRDLIAIFQAIKAAGALQADLEVI